MHQTMEAFGYPETLVREYEDWCVLLRPKQVTLGSLVVVAKNDATQFSKLPDSAFRELASLSAELESTLAREFPYEKINWLMLMMVDPQVHFHVIPRYAEARKNDGVEYADAGWPGPPALATGHDLDESERERLVLRLQDAWGGA